jgi:hypothetical protein
MKEILETHDQMSSQQTLYCESTNKMEYFLHNKKEKFKEIMRTRRKNESPEQRQKRLNQMKQNAKLRRANENPEQRQKRLSQMILYSRQRRASESLDQRVKRLSQMNIMQNKEEQMKPQNSTKNESKNNEKYKA